MGSFLVWISLFAFLTDLTAVFLRDFAHNVPIGLDRWGEEYVDSCYGKYQHPVDFVPYKKKAWFYPPFLFEGFSERPVNGTISKNGHGAVVNFKYKGNSPYIRGGPVYDIEYQFARLHFYWGYNSLEGSEDRINHTSYPAELHMEFSNKVFFGIDEALQHNNGVAVLASFFTIYKDHPPSHAEVGKLLENIHKANSSLKFTNPPALNELLPHNVDAYFTYTGSLTTPPCSEDVIWIDFENPITISESQLEPLRQLKGSGGSPLDGNLRSVQSLNKHEIFYQPYNMPGNPVVDGSASLKSPAIYGMIIFDLFFTIILIKEIFY